MSGATSIIIYNAAKDEYISFGETGPDGEFQVCHCEIDPTDGTVFERNKAPLGPAGVAALKVFMASYEPRLAK